MMRSWSLLVWLVALQLWTASATVWAEPLQCERQECQGHGGHDALLGIMHQCLLERDQGGPLQCPCVALDTAAGIDKGYTLIKDCKGETQFLLIPTATVTGIEDPVLQQAGSTNYLALAWQNRSLVARALGRPLSADQLSLAVNPQNRRSQNQLHIHIDCLSGDVRQTLAALAAGIGPDWQPLPVPLKGHVYRARRVVGGELLLNPFAALYADLARQGQQQQMGLHGLLVTAAVFADGPGLVILDGAGSAAEELQDHRCADARQ